MRRFTLVAAALALFAAAGPGRSATGGGGWGYAVASSYSAASTGSTHQGCAGAPALNDSHVSVATFLVPCGARLQLCYHARCVVATRWDSGPYVAGRQIDLNVGVVRALGFSSSTAWGVRSLRWRRLR